MGRYGRSGGERVFRKVGPRGPHTPPLAPPGPPAEVSGNRPHHTSKSPAPAGPVRPTGPFILGLLLDPTRIRGDNEAVRGLGKSFPNPNTPHFVSSDTWTIGQSQAPLRQSILAEGCGHR